MGSIRKYQRLIRRAKLTSPNVNKNSYIGLLRDIVPEIYDSGLMCIADLFQRVAISEYVINYGFLTTETNSKALYIFRC